MRVADYIAEYLHSIGVTYVFGVGGANIEDFYDACAISDNAPKALVAKHEFSAATMADGYARSGRRLGVVMATSGGGAMNLVAALAEAFDSRVPILALVGQAPQHLEGQGAFQDSSGKAGSIDAVGLFRHVARYCRRVSEADRIGVFLREAAAAALASPQGPAVLLLPKDVLAATLSNESSRLSRAPLVQVPYRPSNQRSAAVTLARAMLERSARPVIIAGSGVWSSAARKPLARLATRLNAWVAVTPDAKHAFDNRHPRYIGVTGVMGHPSVPARIAEASYCLAFGTRLPLVSRGGIESLLQSRPLLYVNTEPHVLADDKVPAQLVEVLGDVRREAELLLEQTSRNAVLSTSPAVNLSRPATPMKELFVPPNGRDIPHALSALPLFESLARALPDDCNVFVDAGNTGAWAVHYLRAPAQGCFVVALGMGGMGYSFGAAIGAAAATGKRAYVIAGDGAFFMHGMEIHTAVEYQLPVTFIILNNHGHAMCTIRERLYFGGDYSFNRFRQVDLNQSMASMLPGLDILDGSSPDRLANALAIAHQARGPAFVSMDVSADELPPFTPFLDAHAKKQESLRVKRKKGQPYVEQRA